MRHQDTIEYVRDVGFLATYGDMTPAELIAFAQREIDIRPLRVWMETFAARVAYAGCACFREVPDHEIDAIAAWVPSGVNHD